jgi:uncharacterized protein YdiU (UPF0061 family)
MNPFHAGRATAQEFDFRHSYAGLPERFHRAVQPTPVSAPRLVKLNLPLAEELGLDVSGLSEAEAASLFSGNALPPASRPIAMAYAGHQFGQFVPQLGDGRAILIGEAVDRNGELRDIQLKGAGPTPFSRRGDGRAALGPVLREYVVSEAMHTLADISESAPSSISPRAATSTAFAPLQITLSRGTIPNLRTATEAILRCSMPLSKGRRLSSPHGCASGSFMAS